MLYDLLMPSSCRLKYYDLKNPEMVPYIDRYSRRHNCPLFRLYAIP